VTYFVIRLLKSNDSRWWIAICAAIGLGVMTKYTMAFLVAGVVAGCSSDAGSAIPEDPMTMVRGDRHGASLAAQSPLAGSASFRLPGVSEKHS
jgi:Dolichyl-phosphate-mannose-protein mannosyltransferase